MRRAVVRRIVHEVEVQSIVMARMATGYSVPLKEPFNDEEAAGVATAAAFDLRTLEAAAVTSTTSGQKEVLQNTQEVPSKTPTGLCADRQLLTPAAQAVPCGFFEKPLTGRASPSWLFRGPVAETVAGGLKDLELRELHDSAVLIEKHIRAFLVRRRRRRRAEEFLASKLRESRQTVPEMVASLDADVLAAQARLAWAFNSHGAVRSAIVEREDPADPLGVDVVQPAQIALEHHDVVLHVSEGYLLVSGVQVVIFLLLPLLLVLFVCVCWSCCVWFSLR